MWMRLDGPLGGGVTLAVSPAHSAENEGKVQSPVALSGLAVGLLLDAC